MKYLYPFMLFALLASCSINNSNPILKEFNQLPEFENLKHHHIVEARQTAEENVCSLLKQYKSIPHEARTFENTLVALDAIYDQIYRIKWPIELIPMVHPDDSIRHTAIRELDHLMALTQKLNQDNDVFRAVKEYSKTTEAKKLAGYKRKFLEDILLDFKRHGLELQTKDVELFHELMTETNQLGMSFLRNAHSIYDTLWIAEEQLAGLSDKFKASHQTIDGKFFIDLPGPSFKEVMQNAETEKIRKQVYYKIENIAHDINKSVLNKLLSARQRLAQLLGYKNYTEYALETRMAKTYENVMHLENRLSEKMRLIAQEQHQELLQLKREHLNNHKLTKLNPWDIQYYNRIYEEKYFAINQDSIKCYFEASQVLGGLINVAERLFDIKFQKIEDASVWHPDVNLYEINDNNDIIGYIYFDLFLRKGKASRGAFAQQVRDRKLTANGIRNPVIVIGCNFSPPTEKEPSLLLPTNIEYLFHEFGHAMHYLLAENDLILQSSFFVENDFLEVPSLIWENWVWDKEVITFISKHYITGKRIHEDMVKIIASTSQRNMFSYQFKTLRYSMIDRIIHTKYSPDQSFDFEAMHKEIWNKIMPYSYPAGIATETAMFPIGISEYAACFYGYLWADIYAKDMFSIFKKYGVFDPKTGARFRECILAPGSSKPAIEMADSFLGRSVDESAFLKALGLDDK